MLFAERTANLRFDGSREQLERSRENSRADSLVTSESIWAGVRLRSGGRTGPQSTPIKAITAFDAGKKPNEASVLTISVASSWAARAAAMSPDSKARINFR